MPSKRFSLLASVAGLFCASQAFGLSAETQMSQPSVGMGTFSGLAIGLQVGGTYNSAALIGGANGVQKVAGSSSSSSASNTDLSGFGAAGGFVASWGHEMADGLYMGLEGGYMRFLWGEATTDGNVNSAAQTVGAGSLPGVSNFNVAPGDLQALQNILEVALTSSAALTNLSAAPGLGSALQAGTAQELALAKSLLAGGRPAQGGKSAAPAGLDNQLKALRDAAANAALNNIQGLLQAHGNVADVANVNGNALGDPYNTGGNPMQAQLDALAKARLDVVPVASYLVGVAHRYIVPAAGGNVPAARVYAANPQGGQIALPQVFANRITPQELTQFEAAVQPVAAAGNPADAGASMGLIAADQGLQGQLRALFGLSDQALLAFQNAAANLGRDAQVAHVNGMQAQPADTFFGQGGDGAAAVADGGDVAKALKAITDNFAAAGGAANNQRVAQTPISPAAQKALEDLRDKAGTVAATALFDEIIRIVKQNPPPGVTQQHIDRVEALLKQLGGQSLQLQSATATAAVATPARTDVKHKVDISDSAFVMAKVGMRINRVLPYVAAGWSNAQVKAVEEGGSDKVTLIDERMNGFVGQIGIDAKLTKELIGGISASYAYYGEALGKKRPLAAGVDVDEDNFQQTKSTLGQGRVMLSLKYLIPNT